MIPVEIALAVLIAVGAGTIAALLYMGFVLRETRRVVDEIEQMVEHRSLRGGSRG